MEKKLARFVERTLICYDGMFGIHQVVSIHGNHIDSTIFIIKTINNLIVNINNQYKLEAAEGI